MLNDTMNKTKKGKQEGGKHYHVCHAVIDVEDEGKTACDHSDGSS